MLQVAHRTCRFFPTWANDSFAFASALFHRHLKDVRACVRACMHVCAFLVAAAAAFELPFHPRGTDDVVQRNHTLHTLLRPDDGQEKFGQPIYCPSPYLLLSPFDSTTTANFRPTATNPTADYVHHPPLGCLLDSRDQLRLHVYACL